MARKYLEIGVSVYQIDLHYDALAHTNTDVQLKYIEILAP